MATGKIFKHFMWIVAIYQALGDMSECQAFFFCQACSMDNVAFSESDFVAAFTILYFSSTTLFKSIYVSKKSRVVGEGFVGKI